MILIDTPRSYAFRGRSITSSHFCSDVPGPEGTAELLGFARRIGMQQKWLQDAGTWREHFDVMNLRYVRAVAAGAKPVSSRELLTATRKKRGGNV